MPTSARAVLAAFGMCVLANCALAQNPTSDRASNIIGSETSSSIAPALPSPDIAPDSSPAAFLHAARAALATGQTGAAQQAMEMAETRLLDRSTPLFQTNAPSRSPLIRQIGDARRALGSGDRPASMKLLDEAIAMSATDG